MTRIKICGITRVEEGLVAADAGADAIGLVFAASRRQVPVDIAREICQALPPFVNKTGVFVNEREETVMEIARYCGLDTLQFHGDESPGYCSLFSQKIIKAISVKEEISLELLEKYQDYTLLFDAYSPGQSGGTGRTFPWEMALQAGISHRLILAGGLHEGNILPALKMIQPFGVDVSSGVETDGVKDHDKIRNFIKTIRRWDYHDSK